jgi:hypothetical protein
MPDPFHVRFNIEVPVKDARRRFINRIENRLLGLADSVRRARDGVGLDELMLKIETSLGEPHDTIIAYVATFMLVWRQHVNGDFSRCLQAVEALYQAMGAAQMVNDSVTETLNQSEVDLGITWQQGVFLKKGAEVLDDTLVNEPLKWLAEPKYENVFVPFKKGLSHLLEGTKDSQRFGDAVTDMYEALEAMAKIVTAKPSKDLAALREEFVSSLSLPPFFKTMLKEYIEYGCDFRHAVKTGQKRTWPLENEAEAFVYLTGLVIRLAIQAEKESS